MTECACCGVEATIDALGLCWKCELATGFPRLPEPYPGFGEFGHEEDSEDDDLY